MRDGWRHVPLGEVASLDIDRVRVETGHQYSIAGVLNGGHGLFKREAIDGSETNYSTLHRLRAGQLVMRKLTAWEGPITCVTGEYEGFFVSAEFPTFTLGPDLLPAYMSLVCGRPEFWHLMKDRSTGSVQRRKRVSPSQLLAIPIDLPTLAEQRRIADLVGAVDLGMRSAAEHLSAARKAYAALANDVLRSDEHARLGDVVDVRMGRQRSPVNAAGPHMVPYLRAANVKDGVLGLADVLQMNFTLEEQRAFALQPGDVLVTEGCGSLAQLGASGQWRGELPGVICFQNTVIRLRAKPGTTVPSFVHHLARRAHHAGWWASVASGTNIFHIGSRRAEGIEVPVPDLATQAAIGSLLDDADAVSIASEAVHRRLKALRSALLLDLFSGEHEIPASYDHFFDFAA